MPRPLDLLENPCCERFAMEHLHLFERQGVLLAWHPEKFAEGLGWPDDSRLIFDHRSQRNLNAVACLTGVGCFAFEKGAQFADSTHALGDGGDKARHGQGWSDVIGRCEHGLQERLGDGGLLGKRFPFA